MTAKANRSMAGELVRFSLPLILSGILQQLYSWADAFIVGHAEGELQLGAIGATHSLSYFFINTILGFTLGLSIMAAQEYGRGNHQKVRRILACFLPVLCGAYTLLSACGMLLAEPILRAMDTPGEIFDYSLQYLRIVFMGIPFLSVYNLYAALLRAVGNTKLSFYAVLLSSGLNILLDVLLVVVLPYGVGGAAMATVISQMAMTVFIVIYGNSKYAQLNIKRENIRFDRAIFKEGLSFSIPPTIQNSITSFGNLILQNFMNGFGATTVLAITTAYRVDSITILPIINLGAAVSSMTARAKGAGDTRRIKNCTAIGIAMVAGVSAALAAGVFFFGIKFVEIFGVTGEALEIGGQFFRDLSSFYVIFGVAVVLRSVLEGIGDIRYSSMIGITTLGVRIASSFLMRSGFANRTVALAEGVSWCFLLLMMGARVIYRRREIGLKEQKIH
ncbi:MAG: MATE family efflux transporter [Clostridia bacterium]|nr:MATE family efflux transporter [Clostridia bacterium]MBQ6703445.1 MATE family efflux transporter [Clostridia bacterium]